MDDHARRARYIDAGLKDGLSLTDAIEQASMAERFVATGSTAILIEDRRPRPTPATEETTSTPTPNPSKPRRWTDEDDGQLRDLRARGRSTPRGPGC